MREDGRPNHIEDALCSMHYNQWFGWTDPTNKIYANLKLSENRAKSTAQYVISKGIDENRISGVGKGENEPVIECSGNCSNEDHRTNRRSEFIIL